MSLFGDSAPIYGQGCFPVIVTNPSPTPAHLRLRSGTREEDATPYAARAVVDGRDVGYQPLVDGAVSPHESAIVSLVFSHGENGGKAEVSLCPSAPFIGTDAPGAVLDGVSSAIELLSDTPVLAVGVHLYQLQAEPFDGFGSQDPTAVYPLFPVHLWSRSPTETGIFQPGLPDHVEFADGGASEPLYPARTLVIAAEDDTAVTFPLPDGTSREVTLQRAEVFAHASNEATIGTAFEASKPISIFSIGPDTTIPWTFPTDPWPDGYRGFQASMPDVLWGTEYVAARHPDRWDGLTEEPPWRIIGGSDGTDLSYAPYHPVGAPDHLARGELAVFFASDPFVVRSQDDAHTFYFGSHMTGPIYQKERFGYHPRVDDDDMRGEPLSVHVLATSRWKRRYDFFALTRFARHVLIVTRKRGGAEVELDCAGVIDGWKRVDDVFEVASVALTGALFEPVVYPNGTCQSGPHTIHSDDDFGATEWAWGDGETLSAIGLASIGAYGLPLFGVDPPDPEAATH